MHLPARIFHLLGHIGPDTIICQCSIFFEQLVIGGRVVLLPRGERRARMQVSAVFCFDTDFGPTLGRKSVVTLFFLK